MFTIICSKTHLGGTTHEQSIICRKWFAGHVVGSRPMKRKGKSHRMIKDVMLCYVQQFPGFLNTFARNLSIILKFSKLKKIKKKFFEMFGWIKSAFLPKFKLDFQAIKNHPEGRFGIRMDEIQILNSNVDFIFLTGKEGRIAKVYLIWIKMIPG